MNPFAAYSIYALALAFGLGAWYNDGQSRGGAGKCYIRYDSHLHVNWQVKNPNTGKWINGLYGALNGKKDKINYFQEW
jgi:hypothetical protein